MQCYSCHQPLPKDAKRCPNCGQEVYSVYTGKPANGRRIDGCHFGPASPKDYRASMKAVALPNQVDLRQWCSPIEDQGQLGSCTANATAGALEYHMIKSGKPAVRMSRLFIYYNTRRLAGHVMLDSGARISEAMASALAYGAPNEQEWPYNPMLFAAEPPPQVYSHAMTYQVAQYARVESSSDGLCGALANGYPIVFGVHLPMECFQAAGATGIIPVPTTPPDPRVDAGHSMLIVGYDMGQKNYLVRNSWGENWGDHGYCRLPFEILQQPRVDEFWIFGNLAQDNALQIIRPTAESEPLQGAVSGLAAELRDQIRADLDQDLAQRAQDIRDRFRKQ